MNQKNKEVPINFNRYYICFVSNRFATRRKYYIKADSLKAARALAELTLLKTAERIKTISPVPAKQVQGGRWTNFTSVAI